jgi:hypothetical protein
MIWSTLLTVWASATGPMYFVFCRLYPSSSPRLHDSVWLLPAIFLLLSNTISAVQACLSIKLERFCGSQKEDERIQSSLGDCVPAMQRGERLSKMERGEPESIKRFIEDQAFSPSCDLAPLPPPLPLSHQQARLAKHMKTEKERQLADGRGGERSQIIQQRKPDPL